MAVLSDWSLTIGRIKLLVALTIGRTKRLIALPLGRIKRLIASTIGRIKYLVALTIGCTKRLVALTIGCIKWSVLYYRFSKQLLTINTLTCILKLTNYSRQCNFSQGIDRHCSIIIHMQWLDHFI